MPAIARRAHHKSRAGCTTCKSKKVKCDEATPCSYCVKRNLPCSLEPSSSPSSGSGRTSKTPDVVSRPYEAPSFTFTDFSLYRHFTVSTALAHADDSGSVIVWREVVADLATQYPYLLHEVLALSALHLRSIGPPEQARALERAAAEHQATAISLFREALARMTAETAPPLFACSCLFIPYHFAAAKDALSLLFNTETGSLAEWLVLIQGCAAITIEHSALLMRSPLRALLGDLYTPKLEELPNGPTDARLVDLCSKLPIVHEYKDCRDAYERTITKLRVCFYISDRTDSSLDRKNAALRFPPLMDQHFREDLAAQLPAALIVMGYWCVLIHRVEERWWLQDRVKPLLLQIEELVRSEYRHLLEWPLEVTGVYSKGD
ncbi:hypothetical protein F5Y13DRAFT_158877 [Hypoxylon sp. FL1857]|nr:hypothetical protein F5Y13DRAFT_158877 [Hypoxylon sp. FL1857]